MMGFSKKRGRPATKRPLFDKGTPELEQKHKAGLTAEPLDVLLGRQLITPQEHQAGLRLRWLYALKFGVPDVKAADPAGHEHKGRTLERDEEWQQLREAEYTALVDRLRQSGTRREIFNLCIYKQWPFWLIDLQLLGQKELSPFARGELARIRTGLTAVKLGKNAGVSSHLSQKRQ